ncbi:2-hydroxyacid dehydrogenase [Sneathiella sp.]|uniref:2-hydroxyacid dehydrogenase n=1 Tax=Sneathiella sp. TaxID=1964365 RepID=UPI002FE3FFAB
MKALLQFSASDRLKKRLATIEDIEITVIDEQDEAGFIREIPDTDVLLHCLKPVSADMIAQGPQLKLIQKIGIGVNTIDLDAAKKAGVIVANMPGTNTAAVAEHTLALMLATLRRMTTFDSATRIGEGWQLSPNDAEAIGEISGSTVGLVGYGAVGMRLAAPLTALGAKLQYWSRTPKPDAIAEAVSFEELLATSDILSLHIPATPETRHILNAAAFGRMKPGAILVNTARGELVDEAALAASLASGRLAGAGLDVFAAEPLRDAGRLKEFPNVVMTPHIAWLTPQTIDRSLAVIEENCRRIRTGEPVLNRVV